MDVNSVKISQPGTYSTKDTASVKKEKKENETEKTVSTNTEAASFEANGGRDHSVTRTGYKVDEETIERLKSESEQRMASLVQKMLGKQVSQLNILDAIKSGQFSQEDIDQAKKDTAEDGYWGVEQTSDRFVQYAQALTGGDPDKLDAMIEAFEKGYAEAEKQWGGELPELTQRTREATLKKFQDLKDQYANNSTSAAAAQSVLEGKVQKAMDEA